jgi:phosphatidylinositol alpha-mannosyltransferase
MKIAQVCPYDLERPGGVQLHVRDTALALRELGHDVTIIAPKVARAASPAHGLEGVKIVEVGRALNIRFGGTAFEVSVALASEERRLARLMKSGFDVVHYHTVWTPLLPLQALARSASASVMTFHDTPPDSLMGEACGLAQRTASKLLSPRIDAAVAVSDSPGRRLHADARRDLVVLPPCTDLRRFREHRQGPRPDGPLNILFVGRLEPRKGVMVLLEAYRRLREQRSDVRLTIAGSGELDEDVRDHVRRHAIPDVTLAGRFRNEDAPALFASCDIFCAPSLYGESFGIVLAEAMASGRAVVAASNAGYRSVLADQAPHCLTPPGDVDALRDKLAALASDPGLRARLGAWGREEALQYDCRVIAPRLEAIYEAAIARRRGRLASKIEPSPVPAVPSPVPMEEGVRP